jgi:hypothetical protein
MKVFNELGLLVESLWRERNYSEGEFPEIAGQALAEIDLAKKGVTPWEIIGWLHTESQLPRQQDVDAKFGNPPITLFCGSRFYVDIYFWLDGTTDIHQHGFAGAFQVLTGSSIHSRYSFQQERAINEYFLLGCVTLDDVELLGEGDIRRIIPGRDHIHSLFHLDRPSCTVTVRTFTVSSKHPQYSYRKPYFAIDPFYQEPSLTKKLQSVAMLLRLQQIDHDDLIGDLLASSDFQTAFLILQTAFKMLGGNQMESFFQLSTSRERFDRLLERAKQKHGHLIDYVMPVLTEEGRQEDIVRRRQFITSNEHRFFLALLLNVSSRQKIFELVKARFPKNNPLDKVLDWVMELSTTKVWGSTEANVLGLDDFDDDYLFVLQCLLEDLSGQQIKDALARDYPADYPAKLESRFEAIAAALRNSIPFRAMLADTDAPAWPRADISKPAKVV